MSGSLLLRTGWRGKYRSIMENVDDHLVTFPEWSELRAIQQSGRFFNVHNFKTVVDFNQYVFIIFKVFLKSQIKTMRSTSDEGFA